MSSYAVSSPEIKEVMNLETGEILSVEEVVGSDYEKTLQLRMRLQQSIALGEAEFACPLCGVPVHLVSLTKTRLFYFRHQIEDGRCPARTKGKYTEKQILAMKYDGARESAAHLRMKHIIADSLRADPNFSNVETEPVWKGVEANSRRRPDVRALWKKSLLVAFEVQLSTTFLRVIAERRAFYLKEGGVLLWVFKGFDTNKARLTQEDIYYNNNRNAFLVTEDTLIASRADDAMTLDCIWSEPSVENGQLCWHQRFGRTTFERLTIDRAGQRVYLFDADSAAENCKQDADKKLLREDFNRYWLSGEEATDNDVWRDIRKRFVRYDIELPRYLGEADDLYRLLNTLYSAKEGRPVGWRFENLVKIAHHIFDRYKGFLWAFRLVLEAHERGPQIIKEDVTKNWVHKKVPLYRRAWKNGDTEFAPDRRFDDLIKFLFPEIALQLSEEPRSAFASFHVD
ncbi:MAG: DUF6035 family protein [Acidihalobacter sp.]|uniref:DUF6035 family protein n=1 Tax=Acidihalobacter sp. TaxID=1872108 RepID=UPI00307DE8E0